MHFLNLNSCRSYILTVVVLEEGFLHIKDDFENILFDLGFKELGFNIELGEDFVDVWTFDFMRFGLVFPCFGLKDDIIVEALTK